MNEQDQLGPSQDGTVMLDIGGDVGALVLHAPPTMAGREIEISLAVDGSPRRHVAVRERRGPRGARYAAIYPSLLAGEYTLWDDARPADTVRITGGEVTEVDWTTPDGTT